MRLLTDRLQWAGDAITFRAGGTSLSGQAVGEGVLAVVSQDWRRIDVLDAGA